MADQWSAIGRKPAEVLKALEDGTLATVYKGSTPDYVHAAIAASAAEAQERAAHAQRRWAKVSAIAASVSTVVAISAVIVAALH